MVSGSKGKKNKGKAKEKMQLAKNPQQLVLAAVLLCILIGKSAFDLFNYIKSQQPAPVSASAPMVDPMDPARNNANPGVNPAGGDIQADANDIYNQTVNMQGPQGPAAARRGAVAGPGGAQMRGGLDQMPQSMEVTQNSQSSVGGDDIEIMTSRKPRKISGKMVKITISEGGRSNPFQPSDEGMFPSLGKYKLTFPPEQLVENSNAAKVMSTTIAGILFDKYSPSAIINIGGTDYLVKRADVINGYKVLAIYKDQVVVKYGNNVYKAGVGQLLELDKVNYNTVANLEKKFGGNNVSINVKKKKVY